MKKISAIVMLAGLILVLIDGGLIVPRVILGLAMFAGGFAGARDVLEDK